MPDDDQPMTLAEALAAAQGCGYQQREFNPNLIEAIDKLGETFGPLGVAMAAAVRTEPQNLMGSLREAYSHQRELWDWLRCDRYRAEHNGFGWVVVDGGSNDEPQVAIIRPELGESAEDAVHALADHLNRKIILAKVAQATVDNSTLRGER